MAHEGIDTLLPREVLRQAITCRLLSDGQLWIVMLERRNLMARPYRVDVTHWESLRHAGLGDHIERVGVPIWP